MTHLTFPYSVREPLDECGQKLMVPFPSSSQLRVKVTLGKGLAIIISHPSNQFQIAGALIKAGLAKNFGVSFFYPSSVSIEESNNLGS